jgi:hypothetical protein
MKNPCRLARILTILAFLLRGTFYCAEQPIWEGFDEWAHFGHIQHLAQYGHPPSRSEPVSDELRRSVELVPVSASAAEYSAESLTHDAFWRLPPEERLRRERELRELRPSYKSAPADNQGFGGWRRVFLSGRVRVFAFLLVISIVRHSGVPHAGHLHCPRLVSILLLDYPTG